MYSAFFKIYLEKDFQRQQKHITVLFLKLSLQLLHMIWGTVAPLISSCEAECLTVLKQANQFKLVNNGQMNWKITLTSIAIENLVMTLFKNSGKVFYLSKSRFSFFMWSWMSDSWNWLITAKWTGELHSKRWKRKKIWSLIHFHPCNFFIQV